MNASRFLPIAALVALTSCSILPDWMGSSDKTPLPGKRELALADEPSVAADPSLATESVTLDAPTEVSDWPQDGSNTRNRMPHVALGAKEFKVVAKASAGDGADSDVALIPSPVVADGKVFAMDARGYVSAHDASDVSKVLWTAPAAPRKDNDMPGGGLAVDGGTVFAVTGNGHVTAFDAAKGSQQWRVSLDAPVRSAPKADAKRLYVLAADNQMFALDRTSGATLWKHLGVRESSGVLGSASPAVARDAVIAAYSSGELYALRAEDGKEAWNDTLVRSRRTSGDDIIADIDVSPIIDRGQVYVTGQGGLFAAFDLARGQRVWDGDISGRGLPVLAENAIFVLSSEGEVVCLSRGSGGVKWVRKLPAYEDEKRQKKPILWTGPMLADGVLLVFGSHGEMWRIAPETGEVAGKVEIPDGVTTLPAMAGGFLYLVTDDATLYALK